MGFWYISSATIDASDKNASRPRLMRAAGATPTRTASSRMADVVLEPFVNGTTSTLPAHAREEESDDEDQTRLYLSAAECAWAFLFDPELDGEADPFDPLFRLASDLYNRSIARALPYFVENRIFIDGETAMPLFAGDLSMVRETHEFKWDPDDLDEVLICYDYEVVGMPGYAREYGLGCPLVAVRKPKELDRLQDEDQFLPTIRQSYSATIVIRFLGSIVDRSRGDGSREAQVEIYNTLRLDEMEVAGRRVTLEADFTTPLAHLLEDAPDQSGFGSMLNPSGEEFSTQLIMLEPYQGDRIPVIFVHGLMSSPQTWMPLFNDLITDPELRHRYQFWFFVYPTGNPVCYSASELRRSLRAVQFAFDPDGTDPEFQDAVLVGHSMGGLLSRYQIQASETRLWNRFAKTPLDELDLEPEEREFLDDLFFFDPVPYVRRMVFMATPHRGSDLADSFIGRLGIALTTVPERIVVARQRLHDRLGDDPTFEARAEVLDSLTGVGTLSPDDPFIQEVASWSLPDALPIHSIIGNEERAGIAGGTDGVVAYESSHLEGVQSELIVESGHNVQEHPATINELRRILHLHLDEHDARRAGDATANGSE